VDRLTRLLTDIARKHLGLETLETRRSDFLDFRELGVWGVDAALREAYWHGFQDAHPNHNQPRFLRYDIMAQALRGMGYLLIVADDEDGFWVRNHDLTKPQFVDDNSFIRLAKARRIVAKRITR
jgi:hypothetical protein